ncbi:MAG: haloacid dehalogenase [Frankiales bacterium]|nr:haloacid dehalogenase [Frankiales bacterium]
MIPGAHNPDLPSAGRGSGLGSCDRPLCEAYDAALYDLDGVLYLGAEAVPHAAAGVAAAVEAGMRTAFVTNNASRRPAAVAAHLRELGIPADAADVVTSAQAAVRLLRERLPAGVDVLVVGAQGLVDEVAAAGFAPVSRAGPEVRAVVQGYGPDTGYAQLAEASLALQGGALWIAANTDSTLPSPRGPLPGNGALVAALRVATGLEPIVAGKPEPALHAESVARVGAKRPLVIGDRLDTDVLGAVRGGADSLLVLTGVVGVSALLAAPAGMRPTYVAPDLRGLLAPQPRVELAESRARCDDASASYDDGEIRVSGDGVAALRAACALAWQCADAGLPAEHVVGLEE